MPNTQLYKQNMPEPYTEYPCPCPCPFRQAEPLLQEATAFQTPRPQHVANSTGTSYIVFVNLKQQLYLKMIIAMSEHTESELSSCTLSAGCWAPEAAPAADDDAEALPWAWLYIYIYEFAFPMVVHIRTVRL
jgi:hypothetical protein